MGIKFNHKLSEYGQELAAHEGQSQKTLDTLTPLKSRLQTLKETITSDAVLEFHTALFAIPKSIKTYANNLP